MEDGLKQLDESLILSELTAYADHLKRNKPPESWVVMKPSGVGYDFWVIEGQYAVMMLEALIGAPPQHEADND